VAASGVAAAVTGVLFLRGYVRAVASFGEHPIVVDAASEVLEAVIGGGPHARAAIGVASLPGGACVELEAVLRLRSGR
jgi:enamine deaminase RidA (YjgF/YER057c/UK114 family)